MTTTTKKYPAPHSDAAIKKAAEDIAAAVQLDLAAAIQAAEARMREAIVVARKSGKDEDLQAVKDADQRLDAAKEAGDAAAVQAAVADLPQPGQPAEESKTTPTPTPKDDAPTNLTGRVDALEKRVDGHDRRHENAEGNLKALNGAVGITQNPEGAWVPIPDGQFARNAEVQSHLGYERDKDGNVTFSQIGGTSFNYTLAGIVGAVVWLVAFLCVWILGDATISKAIVWSLLIGLGAGLATGAIAADRVNKSS